MKKSKIKIILLIILPILGCLFLLGNQNTYAGYTPGTPIGGKCENSGTWWKNVNMYQNGYSCSWAGMGWIKFKVDADWVAAGKSLWFYPSKGNAGTPITIPTACSKTEYFYHYGFFHAFAAYDETYKGTRARSQGLTNTGTPMRKAVPSQRLDKYVDWINSGDYGPVHHTLSISGTQYAHAVEAEYDSSVEQKWNVAKVELGWSESYDNISTFCYDPSWEDKEAKYRGEVKAYIGGSEVSSTYNLGEDDSSVLVSFTHTITRTQGDDFEATSNWDIHPTADGSGATSHTGTFTGSVGQGWNVQTTTRSVTVEPGQDVTVCSSIKYDNIVTGDSAADHTHNGLAAKCITIHRGNKTNGDCPYDHYSGVSKSKFTMNHNSNSYTNNYSSSNWSQTVWGKPGDNLQYQYSLCGGADEPIANGPSNDEPTLGNPHTATFTLTGSSTNGLNGYLFGTQVSGGTVNLTTSSAGFSEYARDIDSPCVDNYACPLSGVSHRTHFYQIHANVACTGSTVIAATDVGTKITQSLKYRYVEMGMYSVPHEHSYCAARDENGSCTSWGTYYTYTYGTQVLNGHNGNSEITASGTLNIPYNYILVPYVKHSNTNGITYAGASINMEAYVATIGRINQKVQSTAYATHTKNTTIRVVSFTTTGTPSSVDKYISGNNMTDSEICRQAGGTANCTSLVVKTNQVLNNTENQLSGATNESTLISNGGSNVNNAISANVPYVEPGTRFCVAVGVYPADSHNSASTSTITDSNQTAAFSTSGSGWKVSMPACVTVAKKPNFSAESSQVVTNGKIETSVTGANNRLFGSWSEYGIIAKGTVSGMGSGAAYGYTTPYNSFTPNNASTNAGAPKSAVNKCAYSQQTIGNESCNLGGATVISTTVDSMAVAKKMHDIYHMTSADMNEGYDLKFGIKDIAKATHYFGQSQNRKTISGKQYVNFYSGGEKACQYDSSLGRYVAPAPTSTAYAFDEHGNKVATVYCTADGNKYMKVSGDAYYGGTNVIDYGGSGTSDLDHTGSAVRPTYRNPVYVLDVEGTIIIDSNIHINNAGTDKFQALDQLPTIIIFAKNVIISDSVTRLDAWIIAGLDGGDGKINTCGYRRSTNSLINSSDLTSDICNSALYINGPVYATSAILNRTFGGGNSADKFVQRAEIFNLRSDAYYWAYYQSQRNRILTTVYSRELPVRY